MLIYRLDRLLYANSVFLQRMGYADLPALEEAGGLDALYVEPGVSGISSRSDTGKPVTISATQGLRDHTLPATTEARLYTITWDDDSALALIFSNTANADIPAAPDLPSPVGYPDADELGTILDTTAEGILMFDAEGNINSANRSAEALFGHDSAELVQRNLIDLFAPENAQAVKDYLESVKGAAFASLLEQGRDVLVQVRGGGLIPVSMTMGRTRPTGPNFFAVFRDLSQAKKSESELREAQQRADRAANATADVLTRISHEVRTPLNAIIGFAEVMLGQRFGTLGNERYVEHLKDIRASGERVIAVINDLLDISRIESGKLDLAFTSQNLNETGRAMRRADAAAGQSRTHHHPHLARAGAAAGDGGRARVAPDHAQPDRQFDPSRQCRRTGHRLDRVIRFRRRGAAGARYRPGSQRQ